MFDFSNTFPNYDVDEKGNVYKQGQLIKPFKSNKYLQVVLFDKDNNKKVLGVHTVVAMKYLNYFEGCIVHHKNENTHDNNLENLQIFSRNEHSRMHGINNVTSKFKLNRKGKPAWNKGLKMSDEFCKQCSITMNKRWRIIKNEKVDPFIWLD